MNKPVVSVVMIVCNRDRFLAETIESILGQTFHDFEFLIVDYGSTDESKTIISSFAAKDKRVKLREIPNCSLPEARNAGCFLAQGKYIAIIDADDISLPERLKWEVEFMERHPEVGVVGGGIGLIDARGASLPNSALWYAAAPRPVENCEIQSALLSYCAICQNSVLMRSEAFALVGGYRTAFLQAEDYDLWMRIAERFEMANLKQVLFKKRIHPHQLSVRKRTQQTLCTLAVKASAACRRSGQPDPLDSIKEITPAVLAGLGVSEATQQSALSNEYRDWIHGMCAAGEWSGAMDAATEMLRSSDWKYVERRVTADMRLEAAYIYWKNNRFLKSILTGGYAVVTRPKLLGRPLKRLLKRFELLRTETTPATSRRI